MFNEFRERLNQRERRQSAATDDLEALVDRNQVFNQNVDRQSRQGGNAQQAVPQSAGAQLNQHQTKRISNDKNVEQTDLEVEEISFSLLAPDQFRCGNEANPGTNEQLPADLSVSENWDRFQEENTDYEPSINELLQNLPVKEADHAQAEHFVAIGEQRGESLLHNYLAKLSAEEREEWIRDQWAELSPEDQVWVKHSWLKNYIGEKPPNSGDSLHTALYLSEPSENLTPSEQNLYYSEPNLLYAERNLNDSEVRNTVQNLNDSEVRNTVQNLNDSVIRNTVQNLNNPEQNLIHSVRNPTQHRQTLNQNGLAEYAESENLDRTNLEQVNFELNREALGGQARKLGPVSSTPKQPNIDQGTSSARNQHLFAGEEFFSPIMSENRAELPLTVQNNRQVPAQAVFSTNLREQNAPPNQSNFGDLNSSDSLSPDQLRQVVKEMVEKNQALYKQNQEIMNEQINSNHRLLSVISQNQNTIYRPLPDLFNQNPNTAPQSAHQHSVNQMTNHVPTQSLNQSRQPSSANHPPPIIVDRRTEMQKQRDAEKLAAQREKELRSKLLAVELPPFVPDTRTEAQKQLDAERFLAQCMMERPDLVQRLNLAPIRSQRRRSENTDIMDNRQHGLDERDDRNQRFYRSDKSRQTNQRSEMYDKNRYFDQNYGDQRSGRDDQSIRSGRSRRNERDERDDRTVYSGRSDSGNRRRERSRDSERTKRSDHSENRRRNRRSPSPRYRRNSRSLSPRRYYLNLRSPSPRRRRRTFRSQSPQNDRVDLKPSGSRQRKRSEKEPFEMSEMSKFLEGMKHMQQVFTAGQYTQVLNNLPILTGDRGSENTKSFFLKFESATEGWPEKKKMEALKLKLKGKAANALEHITEKLGEKTSAAVIIQSLIEDLKSTDYREASAFSDLKRNGIRYRNESIEDFASRTYDLVKKAYPGLTTSQRDDIAKNYFKENINDPEISRLLSFQMGGKTFHELANTAIQMHLSYQPRNSRNEDNRFQRFEGNRDQARGPPPPRSDQNQNFNRPLSNRNIPPLVKNDFGDWRRNWNPDQNRFGNQNQRQSGYQYPYSSRNTGNSGNSGNTGNTNNFSNSGNTWNGQNRLPYSQSKNANNTPIGGNNQQKTNTATISPIKKEQEKAEESNPTHTVNLTENAEKPEYAKFLDKLIDHAVKNPHPDPAKPTAIKSKKIIVKVAGVDSITLTDGGSDVSIVNPEYLFKLHKEKGIDPMDWKFAPNAGSTKLNSQISSVNGGRLPIAGVINVPIIVEGKLTADIPCFLAAVPISDDLILGTPALYQLGYYLANKHISHEVHFDPLPIIQEIVPPDTQLNSNVLSLSQNTVYATVSSIIQPLASKIIRSEVQVTDSHNDLTLEKPPVSADQKQKAGDNRTSGEPQPDLIVPKRKKRRRRRKPKKPTNQENADKIVPNIVSSGFKEKPNGSAHSEEVRRQRKRKRNAKSKFGVPGISEAKFLAWTAKRWEMWRDRSDE